MASSQKPTCVTTCTADFCLIPIGGEDGSSVGKYIAECQRVLAGTGLTYKMHGYGTGLEGSWDEVMAAIKACHEAVHQMGCPRVATDIRIGTRLDKPSTLEAKVQSVEEHLKNQTS
ncbi:uncharacterized protein MELLADRAFT_101042 [Melampsora larici-populina 98AG31]|uniref:Thiamine-binding protein domain-containing protein n=1 Tax=Melampsora larici-populina (strain 98AG31 / pathotype 3-4-7) TaxID=747676 RepID=F4R3F5_MELLP|nr:uncharacterized protein MELLADRAFT_101042 [Melampsora larici-populina 98AG31]EGG12619.1 hypothetical protein MELLADRAFT_101042 [Melampsora larici-populina 98AG31]